MRDWFSKMFGIFPKSPDENVHEPLDHFNESDKFSFSWSFTPFGNSNDPFQMIDELMRSFGDFHVQSDLGGISDLEPSSPQSLRESMLKTPDTVPDVKPDITKPHRQYPSPFFSEPHNGRQPSVPDEFSNQNRDIWSFGNPFSNITHAFKMMNEMFKDFHEPNDQFFDSFSHPFPQQPGSDERKDLDLDEENFSSGSLFKKGPSFSYGDSVGPIVPSQVEPYVKRKFVSRSVVRIRRPDGSIEEKRTYTDSSGREEETISTHEPTIDRPNLSGPQTPGDANPSEGDLFSC